ncbi:hypothetical protein Tco_0975475, partial [Tanacetum coccineum]
MLAIFHDMIKEFVKVFTDDFSVFGDSFDKCLNNLDKMLQHCKDAHLVLNWVKCHFIFKEGIVLGHKVSSAGLEVDKAKINVISKLPPLPISKVYGYIKTHKKTVKNGHENLKSTKRSQRIKAEARNVKPQSKIVNHGQISLIKRKSLVTQALRTRQSKKSTKLSGICSWITQRTSTLSHQGNDMLAIL